MWILPHRTQQMTKSQDERTSALRMRRGQSRLWCILFPLYRCGSEEHAWTEIFQKNSLNLGYLRHSKQSGKGDEWDRAGLSGVDSQDWFNVRDIIRTCAATRETPSVSGNVPRALTDENDGIERIDIEQQIFLITSRRLSTFSASATALYSPIFLFNLLFGFVKIGNASAVANSNKTERCWNWGIFQHKRKKRGFFICISDEILKFGTNDHQISCFFNAFFKTMIQYRSKHNFSKFFTD